MSTRPIIFISAVSKELHSARALVSQTLTSLGYDPKSQDIAPTETGMLPKVLRDWIDQSDAVLQLVGHCYGFAPESPDPDFGECSYTQYEALYARQQGKKVWYLILSPEHPTDPCDPEAPALRALQDAYRTKVTGTDYLYHPSSSLDRTALLVHGIKDELAELRQQEQARQEKLHQTLDATHQKVTDLTAEVLARFDDLKQQANRQPQLPLTPASWPQPAPFHNRAFPDQHNFVGRTTLLSAMKQSLDAERNVALTQPLAMHGAGGIGKTRAAVEFARAHGSDYTLRLFLDAQSPESLRASLAEVARKLELTTDLQAKEKDLVLLALRLLRAVPTALVVADNADTPAALEAVRLLCHQPGGVRWLITTRLTDLGEEFAAQPVELLSEAEAVKLLQQRGRKNRHHPGSDTEALAVAIELGRLPLALQQAGAYVAHQRLAWAAYRRLLNANPVEAFSHEAREMKDLPESILRTYRISLQQLSPPALSLLQIAAHLAPAPIPEVVFLDEDTDSATSFRSALIELADLSLLEWRSSQLELHRAIAIAVRHGLSHDEHRELLEMACIFVATGTPKETDRPEHWPAWAALRPHIEHLLAAVVPAGADLKTYRSLLVALPNYLHALGDSAAAEVFYRSAISIMQQSVGAEHSDTLGCRMNLASALNAQGRSAEAVREQQEVLQIQEKVLGAEHSSTLGNRMNLANALSELGRHDEAEKEHRAVLQVRERVDGAEHRSTLMSRMNLATTLQDQGRHAEAEQEHRAVCQICARVLGAEDPATLTGRMNLANALHALGRHAEAEQEHRAVLKIKERVLGAEHPNTMVSQMNLGASLNVQEKHAQAEHVYRSVLRIQERVLGPEHPDVALSCFNLALSLKAQQKLPQALALMQQAQQVWTNALGADHPHTKRATAALGHVEAALK